MVNQLSKAVSFILFFTGLFMVATSTQNITGAVIGSLGSISPQTILGIILLIFSGLIFISGKDGLSEIAQDESRKLPRRPDSSQAIDHIPIEDFSRRISDITHADGAVDDSSIAILLDTSALIEYKNEGIVGFLDVLNEKYQGRVYVPTEVLSEISGPLRTEVESRTTQITGFEHYRDAARSYLEKTDKARLYSIIIDFYDVLLSDRSDFEKASALKDMASKNKDAMAEMKTLSHTIVRKLKLDGICDVSDIREIFIGKKYDENTRARAKKKIHHYLNHCQVSKADTDVLATALYEAEQGRYIVIGEVDSDFEQAIRFVKQERPEIGKFIDYVNSHAKSEPRKQANGHDMRF